jgi:hypothetical protein
LARPLFVGFVLRLRGVVCLHASAVALNERAIAFIGPGGVGKSTTAAHLSACGYQVISDDVLALREEGGVFVVQPGYPGIRLWPASVKLLYGKENALPRLTPNWEKRHLDLRKQKSACRKSLPLAAGYLFAPRSEDSNAPRVERLSASEVFVGLVGNTYANGLLNGDMRAHEFSQLGKLVATVPIRRLVPHADPAGLAKMSDAIADDFQRLLAATEDHTRSAGVDNCAR